MGGGGGSTTEQVRNRDPYTPEMLATYGAAHAKKQELRTQVEVATDKTALSAIIINF